MYHSMVHIQVGILIRQRTRGTRAHLAGARSSVLRTLQLAGLHALLDGERRRGCWRADVGTTEAGSR